MGAKKSSKTEEEKKKEKIATDHLGFFFLSNLNLKIKTLKS